MQILDRNMTGTGGQKGRGAVRKADTPGKPQYNITWVQHGIQDMLGAYFVAEGPIRRNTFGRLAQSRSYQSKGFRVHFQMHRLKDEMTNRPVITCIMIVNLCKGHECNFSQAVSCAYK
jgi:hypothetical protein